MSRIHGIRAETRIEGLFVAWCGIRVRERDRPAERDELASGVRGLSGWTCRNCERRFHSLRRRFRSRAKPKAKVLVVEISGPEAMGR